MGKYELQVDADSEEKAHAKLEEMVANKVELPPLLFADIDYITILMEERSRKVMDVPKEVYDEEIGPLLET